MDAQDIASKPTRNHPAPPKHCPAGSTTNSPTRRQVARKHFCGACARALGKLLRASALRKLLPLLLASALRGCAAQVAQRMRFRASARCKLPFCSMTEKPRCNRSAGVGAFLCQPSLHCWIHKEHWRSTDRPFGFPLKGVQCSLILCSATAPLPYICGCLSNCCCLSSCLEMTVSKWTVS